MYTPGNPSDVEKHKNLAALVNAVRPTTYVELHSGAGQYRAAGVVYDGSSLRTLKQLDELGIKAQVFLHEINEGRRTSLVENTEPWPQVKIRRSWQDSIDEYVAQANPSWLFLVDPCKVTEYEDLFEPVDDLLKTGASLFLYVPVVKRWTHHKEIFKLLKGAVAASGRDVIEHCSLACKGWFERYDYNLLVSDKAVLDKIRQKPSA